MSYFTYEINICLRELESFFFFKLKVHTSLLSSNVTNDRPILQDKVLKTDLNKLTFTFQSREF